MAIATLPTRQLGITDMRITTVGFGAWAVGGGDWSFGWGPQDDADSVATIRRALELGINWIDTAAVYGLRRSEEVVRRALADLPSADRPLVFTQGGLVWDERERMAARSSRSGRTRSGAGARPPSGGSGWNGSICTSSTGPTRSERRSRIPGPRWCGSSEEGKVRAGGVSNFDVGLLERCERIRHADALQPPFSLIRREAAEAQLPWCASHGAGPVLPHAGPTADRR